MTKEVKKDVKNKLKKRIATGVSKTLKSVLLLSYVNLSFTPTWAMISEEEAKSFKKTSNPLISNNLRVPLNDPLTNPVSPPLTTSIPVDQGKKLTPQQLKEIEKSQEEKKERQTFKQTLGESYKVKLLSKTDSQDEGLLFKWSKKGVNGSLNKDKLFLSFTASVHSLPTTFSLVKDFYTHEIKHFKWKVSNDLTLIVLKDGSLIVDGKKKDFKNKGFLFSSSQTLSLKNMDAQSVYAKANDIKTHKKVTFSSGIFKLNAPQSVYENNGYTEFNNLQVLKGSTRNKGFLNSLESFKTSTIHNLKDGLLGASGFVQSDHINNKGNVFFKDVYLSGASSSKVKTLDNRSNFFIKKGDTTFYNLKNEGGANFCVDNPSSFKVSYLVNESIFEAKDGVISIEKIHGNSGEIRLFGKKWGIGSKYRSKNKKILNFLDITHKTNFGLIKVEDELFFENPIGQGEFYANTIHLDNKLVFDWKELERLHPKNPLKLSFKESVLKENVDVSHLDLDLNANSFTNPSFTFKTKSFKGRFKNLFKVGNSNESMGTFATCNGALDIEAGEIDARYAKIFSKCKGRLISTEKDFRIGDMKEVRERHALGDQFNNPFYMKKTFNGAYIISDEELELQAPSSNILLDYGQVGSYKKGTVLKASQKNGLIRLTSGLIHSTGPLKLYGYKFLATRPDQIRVDASKQNIQYWSGHCYDAEQADPSCVSGLDDVYFYFTNTYVLYSHILAGNSFYLNNHLILRDKLNNDDISLTLESRNSIKHRNNDCANGSFHYESDAGDTSAISFIKAGKEIKTSTGAVVVGGSLQSPIVKIDVTSLLTKNTNKKRDDDSTPQVNLVLDLAELSKKYFSKEGFIKSLDNGCVTTDQPLSGGFLPSPNQMVLTSPTVGQSPSPTPGLSSVASGFSNFNANNPESFFISGVPLEFLLQNVLADYLGKLNIKGVSGSNLLNLLHNNAGDVLNDARANRAGLQDPASKETRENSQLLSEQDLKAATKSFITYMAKEIAGQVRLAATLVLNTNDINTYTQVGDIVSDLSTTITTTGPQVYENSRIISGGDITLESLENDLNFITEKYTTTHYLEKGTVQTKEHLMPKMQVISKKGSITKKAKGNINETATDTIAPKGYVIRESDQGTITIKDETLKTTTTSTNTKRNWMGSAKTTTQSSTSYEFVPSTTVGGLGVFNKASQNTITEKGSKVTSGEKISYEAKKLILTSSVAHNVTSETTTTKGITGNTKTSGVTLTTPVFNQTTLNAPVIEFIGDEAHVSGVHITAKTLLNKLKLGLTLKDLRGKYEMSYAMSQSNCFGGMRAGGTQGGEVSLPTTLNVEEIITDGYPLKLVNLNWNKDKTVIIGDYEEIFEALKTWSSSYKSAHGIFDPKIATTVGIAISLALNYVIPGVGAAVGKGLSSAGMNAAVAGIVGSGVQGLTVGMINRASMCLLQNGLDVGAAAVSLYESTTASDAAFDFTVGAVLGSPGSGAGLPFLDVLIQNTYHSLMKAGLKVLIKKEKVGDAVKEGLISAGINSVASYGAGKIGQMYDSGKGSINYGVHKAFHAALGGFMGYALGGNTHSTISGAAGAVFAEIISETMQEAPEVTLARATKRAREDGHGDLNSETLRAYVEAELQKTVDITRIATALSGLCLDLNVELMDASAHNALMNNFSVSQAKEVLAAYADSLIESVQNVCEDAEAYLEELCEEAYDKVVELHEFMEAHPDQVDIGVEAIFAISACNEDGSGFMMPSQKLAQKKMLKTALKNTPSLVKNALEKMTPKLLERAGKAPKTSTNNPSLTKEDIFSKKTQKGIYESSNTTSSEYWKTRQEYTFNGQTNKVYQRDDLIDPMKIDLDGKTNLERMKQGKAPMGSDTKSMELHHMTQTKDGGIAEVTSSFHKKNTKVIHINPNTTQSGIDRSKFDKWRKDYWKDRAKDFEKKGDQQ